MSVQSTSNMSLVEELPALIATLVSPGVNMGAVGTALALLLESILGKEAARVPKKAAKGAKSVEPERAPEGEAPPSEDYLLPSGAINHVVCLGRTFNTKDSDKRWSKPLYREKQCGKKRFQDHDLCDKCLTKMTEGKKTWNGKVGEAPADTCHMPDTLWFTDNKVYWRGWIAEKKGSGSGSGSGASVVETATVMAGDGDEDGDEEDLPFHEAAARAYIETALATLADPSTVKVSSVAKETILSLTADFGGKQEEFKDQIKSLIEVIRDECIASAAAAAAAAEAAKPVKKKAASKAKAKDVSV